MRVVAPPPSRQLDKEWELFIFVINGYYNEEIFKVKTFFLVLAFQNSSYLCAA